MNNPFEYPKGPRVRRHAPAGYTDHGSYREWLRDEFDFRCVYSLLRETWMGGKGEFVIDHVVSQTADLARVCDYTNLVYCHHRINLIKGDKTIPDPCSLNLSECLQVDDEGILTVKDPEKNPDAQELVTALRLDGPDLTRTRHSWIRILATLAEHNPKLYAEKMGLPDNLVDLSTLKPEHNYRPEGIEESAYAESQAA